MTSKPKAGAKNKEKSGSKAASAQVSAQQVATIRASAAPKGCCTISSPGEKDRSIPNITEAECNAIMGAHPESVTDWVVGDCAK